MNKNMRYGYTTGTCAAGAAKAAAILLFTGKTPPNVKVELPAGGIAVLAIHSIKRGLEGVWASVIKDAGDDPDVTHGIEICALVTPANEGITITGGEGVGLVTKPGLQVPVGNHAINPVPQEMISKEVHQVLPPNQGAKISIIVPRGIEVAKKTMNARLGIVDGISILGTGGVVRPMSADAYLRSLIPQIDVALAQGYNELVLTPGRMGVNRAKAMGVPEDCIVETSNFMGIMLKECVTRGVKQVLMMGHLGKMIKLAGGIFQTHSRLADGRKEIITAHAAILGASKFQARQLMETNTTEHAVQLLKEWCLTSVFQSIANAAEIRCHQFCNEEVEIGVVMYSMTGELMGCSDTAVKIGGKKGWHIP